MIIIYYTEFLKGVLNYILFSIKDILMLTNFIYYLDNLSLIRMFILQYILNFYKSYAPTMINCSNDELLNSFSTNLYPNNKEFTTFYFIHSNLNLIKNHTCLNSLSAFFLFNFSSGVSSFGLIDKTDKADITDLEPDFGVSLLSKNQKSNYFTLFIFNSNSSAAFFNISDSIVNVPSISSVSNAPIPASSYSANN
ncbi:hypothetical protein AGLY_003135 [Aphis glycines]|uniref:Uncharacterized protein n=1 Tax=Aphis glycines TaxID=307491 RepID=A0A6G0U2C1_APHGL|nr:hypothetical protein AGLY_003135 [Aphis glycines]